MGDEVSGSDRDISLSHIYVQFSSQRCVKGYIDSFIDLP